MVIDAHDHPGKWAPIHQAEEGIDISVLLPIGDENQQIAIRQVRENPDRFILFAFPGWAEQWDQALEKVRALAEEHPVRGVKFQPLVQHGYPDDPRLYPLYEFCCERGLVVLWHCGIVGFRRELGRPHLARYANTVPGIDQVAADFPELKIIIAHLGGNFIQQACVIAEKHENIYMDTSYLGWFAPRMFPPTTPEEMILHAIRVVGHERILYGYEGVSPQVIRRLALPAEQTEAILWRNAARLFDLKLPAQ